MDQMNVREVPIRIEEVDGAPPRLARKPMPPVRGGGEARFLVFLGCTSFLVGLALCTLPRFSWKAGQIMVGLDYLGIHGGVFVVGGLLLVGLGMVRRGQVQLAHRSDDLREDSHLLEEIATDLVQARTSLDALQLGAIQMQSRIADVSCAVSAELQAAREETQQRDPHDSIYRLAASLDQLGARIDQRFKAGQDALDEGMEELRASVASARTVLVRISTALESGLPRGMGFAGDDPPAEHAESPLELLDRLDEGVRREPVRTQAAAWDSEPAPDEQAWSEETRHAPIDPEWIDQQAPVLPGGRWPHAEEPALEVASPEDVTREKLDQLRSLLDDPDLRAALEQMRHGR